MAKNWLSGIDEYEDNYSVDGSLFRALSTLAYNIELRPDVAVVCEGTASVVVSGCVTISGFALIAGTFVSDSVSNLTPFAVSVDGTSNNGVMFRLRAGAQTVYVDKIEGGQVYLTAVTVNTTYPVLMVVF